MTQVLVKRRHAVVLPPPAEGDQLPSHIDEIKPTPEAVSKPTAGRKGIDAATQKRIYDLSKQGMNAKEIAEEVKISYQTARKYMSAKVARGVKPVTPKNPTRAQAKKLHLVAPVEQSVPVQAEPSFDNAMSQLELAINILQLTRKWNIPFESWNSLVAMAKRIEQLKVEQQP